MEPPMTESELNKNTFPIDDSDEEVIRSEARVFCKAHLERCLKTHNMLIHSKFVEALKLDLNRFYQPNSKAIYLNELMLILLEYRESKIYIVNDIGRTMLRKIIFFVQQEIDALPQIIKKNATNSGKRHKVFVSYNQANRQMLDRMKKHFVLFEDKIDFWDDSRILPGQKWQEEIEKAMTDVKVALLLVDADFFASEFISTKELPRLLKAAEEEGATILIIVIGHCPFKHSTLSDYQTLNKPDIPVSAMSLNDQERLWAMTADQVWQVIHQDCPMP